MSSSYNPRKRSYADSRDDKGIKKKFDFSNTHGTRFLIPSKAAGMMIGKGGDVIKSIRAKFPDCRIIVPDSDGPERIVLIDGSIEIIAKIWDEALPMLKEIMNAKECDYRAKDGKSNQSEEELDLRVLVHESIVGSIIGKGGERIKSLIDKHNMTMIKIASQLCPRSTDRVVRMVAVHDNLLECLKAILETLSEQVIKGPREDYNPNFYDESYAPQYGGFMSKDHRFSSRRPDDRVKESSKRPFDNHRIEENLNSMRSFLMGSSGRRSPPPFDSTTDLMNGVMPLPSPNEFGVHISRVSVATYLVDAIVGRDGRRIMDIRQDSGADIEFNVNRFSDECIFIIQGNADQIFKAQCLLQLCARKFGGERDERERSRPYY